ncbi:MAG: DUF4112 domain-containing protein, partial [Myxococcota bacterium]
GDIITLAPGLYILAEAARLGVGLPKLVRMAANIAVDCLVGAIPVVGDLADLTIKANVRNEALLLDHFGIAHDADLDRLAPGLSRTAARPGRLKGLLAFSLFGTALVALAVGVGVASTVLYAALSR